MTVTCIYTRGESTYYLNSPDVPTLYTFIALDTGDPPLYLYITNIVRRGYTGWELNRDYHVELHGIETNTPTLPNSISLPLETSP